VASPGERRRSKRSPIGGFGSLLRRLPSIRPENAATVSAWDGLNQVKRLAARVSTKHREPRFRVRPKKGVPAAVSCRRRVMECAKGSHAVLVFVGPPRDCMHERWGI